MRDSNSASIDMMIWARRMGLRTTDVVVEDRQMRHRRETALSCGMVTFCSGGRRGARGGAFTGGDFTLKTGRMPRRLYSKRGSVGDFTQNGRRFYSKRNAWPGDFTQNGAQQQSERRMHPMTGRQKSLQILNPKWQLCFCG